MKLIKLTLLVTLLALSSISQADAIYVCIGKNGQKTYTAEKTKGCKLVQNVEKNLNIFKHPTTTSSSNNSAGTYNTYSRGDSNYSNHNNSNYSYHSEDNNDIETANNNYIPENISKVKEAEKALEEGKKVRYGNERNYAKYQGRIRKLEQAVEEAKNNARLK